MTHEQIQDRLSEWLDGELDPAAAAAVSGHLDSCADCAARAGRLRRASAALFAKPVLSRASNEAFTRAVMARVEAESVPAVEAFPGCWLVPPFGLALAGLLAALWLPSIENFELPIDAQLVADGRGPLPSYDGVLGVAP